MSSFETIIQQIRACNPLVHHLTNYVTVNDCANITLAIGGSPIMADAIQEVAEITAKTDALVLNIGTLNEQTVNSMILAGKEANKHGIPVIFDPVGVGISQFRMDVTKKLLNSIHFTVIRGNYSEILCLAGIQTSAKGVDTSLVNQKKETEVINIARTLASSFHCIIVITGAIDIVSDGVRTMQVKNGCAAMRHVTGTGCMLDSLIASFCGGYSDDFFEAAVSSVIAMGVAGELAFEKAKTKGTGSLRTHLIDEISKLTDQTLSERGDYIAFDD